MEIDGDKSERGDREPNRAQNTPNIELNDLFKGSGSKILVSQYSSDSQSLRFERVSRSDRPGLVTKTFPNERVAPWGERPPIQRRHRGTPPTA